MLMDREMGTAAVGYHNVVKEMMMHWIKTNEYKKEGGITASAPTSVQIFCASVMTLEKWKRSCA